MTCISVPYFLSHRPRYPQSQGVIERSNKPFKDALKDMMKDAKTEQWPKLVAIAQGAVNNRKKRGYSRTPYELVFGVSMRAGYDNGKISTELLSLIVNEAGLDAAMVNRRMDMPAAKKAVLDAQAVPMVPASPEVAEDLIHTASSMTPVPDTFVNPPPAPLAKTDWNDTASAWRKYQHPVSNKKLVLAVHVPHIRDSKKMKARKLVHDLTLQKFGKRFIEGGMWQQALLVGSLIAMNNKHGYKSMKTFTPTMKADLEALLPNTVLPNAIVQDGSQKKKKV